MKVEMKIKDKFKIQNNNCLKIIMKMNNKNAQIG